MSSESHCHFLLFGHGFQSRQGHLVEVTSPDLHFLTGKMGMITGLTSSVDPQGLHDLVYLTCSVCPLVVSSCLQPHGLYSLPGSSVHGSLQARILECVAMPFSKGLTQESNPGLLHCRQILYQLSYKGSPYQSQNSALGTSLTVQ